MLVDILALIAEKRVTCQKALNFKTSRERYTATLKHWFFTSFFSHSYHQSLESEAAWFLRLYLYWYIGDDLKNI